VFLGLWFSIFLIQEYEKVLVSFPGHFPHEKKVYHSGFPYAFEDTVVLNPYL
jgi:hypothetical protein